MFLKNVIFTFYFLCIFLIKKNITKPTWKNLLYFIDKKRTHDKSICERMFLAQEEERKKGKEKLFYIKENSCF